MQIILALALSLALGWVFERYHFCMNSTITDVFLFRDTGKLKGLIAGLLLSAVLFNILIALGVTKADATPLWHTTIFAGLVFGIGMNLAGGCVSGTLFKMGQGYVASFIAFLGVTLGLGAMGVMMSLMPLPAAGMKPVQRGTLPAMLGVNPLLFAIGAVAVFLLAYGGWSMYRRRVEPHHLRPVVETQAKTGGWWSSFVVGGILVAVLNSIFFAVFSSPIGLAGSMAYAASGVAYMVDGAWARTNPMFGHLMAHPEYALVGVLFLIGAIVSAAVAGRFQLRIPVRRQAISSLIGGVLMGVSTALMIGCNVTHVLGGLPQFAVGSLVATLGIVIGAWIGAKLTTRIVARAA